MRVLITSIGKRVELINHFKRNFYVIGTDLNKNIAAIDFVDKFIIIPPADNSDYCDTILKICDTERVDILIPLYEGEFVKLDSIRYKLESIGTKLLLSSAKVLKMTKDKMLTYGELKRYDIDMPKAYTYEQGVEQLKCGKSLFIKPRDGMGSKNTFKIESTNELTFFNDYIRNNIIQELVDAEEYTVDILLDLKGNPIYIIPRKRIEVRSGEVVKSKIDLDKKLIDKSKFIISIINKRIGKIIGPITFQFFKNDNSIKLIEINPRLGGGVTLSLEAGADYSGKISKMYKGEIHSKFNESIKPLGMVRYEVGIYR